MRDSDLSVFLLVFSVADRAGFQTVDALREKITRQAPLILVGTQSDRVSDRVVSTNESQQKSQQWHCDYIEVSAKTRENVEGE